MFPQSLWLDAASHSSTSRLGTSEHATGEQRGADRVFETTWTLGRVSDGLARKARLLSMVEKSTARELSSLKGML